MSRRLALLVAADRYEAAELNALRAPAHDVEALAAALSAPAIGGFEVARSFNRPVHEVNAAIEDLFCEKRPDDVLLLYVSCHGVKDDGGRLYFATANTRINRLGSSAVASTFVSEQMSRSMSRNVILLLDCCYSGAFVEGLVRRGTGDVGITERLRGSGRAILSSSSALEYAFELDDRHVTRDISVAEAGRGGAGGPSIFTGAIVEGLVTGEADQDHDGRISIDELYDYAYTKVTSANPHQTPTKFSDVSGELIIARSPRTARPPSLPAEVASAIEHPLQAVRLAAVDTLTRLALVGDAVGRLAHQHLANLLSDDSRSVAAKAHSALAEIDRALPGVHRAAPHALSPWAPPVVVPWPGAAQPDEGPGRRPVPVPPPAPPVGPVFPHAGRVRPAEAASWRPPAGNAEEGLRGAAVLAYFLPFFTSLVMFVSRSSSVKYHAVQAGLIDAIAVLYLVAAAIPMGVYSSARYGAQEVPAGDPVFNLWAGSIFVLPLLLRGYCLIQLARRGTVRLWLVGALARRIAYRNEGARRSVG